MAATQSSSDKTFPRLRVAIFWPLPRLARILKCLADDRLHEEMDGLSFLRDYGIESVVFDSSRKPWNPLTGRGALWSGIDPIRMFKFLRQYKSFDALVSIDSSSCFLLALFKRFLRFKKPIIVIDPALDPGYVNRTRMHNQVLPFAEHAIVFGKVQEQYLDKQYGKTVRCTFVPHRMDTAFFDPMKASVREQEQLVLSVGNDIGRDYDTMVAAARSLSAPVLLHTSRPLPSPLPRNVRVRSEWITFEDLRDTYASASVIAVPLRKTLHASGINALLEAMSMGKPVVVSASPGITDYVQHGVNAWLVEPGDPGALSMALETLLSDSGLRRRLGKAAREYCESTCAMKVYAGTLARIIREAVAFSK